MWQTTVPQWVTGIGHFDCGQHTLPVRDGPDTLWVSAVPPYDMSVLD
ncbi:hypothetical protein [Paraburkholderia sp.]|nr:hypothetical protein [Paraburkholderia sp.]